MALIQTTINQLRTAAGLNPTDEYYTTDLGQEGFGMKTALEVPQMIILVQSYTTQLPPKCSSVYTIQDL